MSEPSSTAGGSNPIVVPADVRVKHGALVDLILASESMNDDERRYWIDILPVMSEEQIAKLQDILVREKEQLNAIDAKYATDMSALSSVQAMHEMGEKRSQKLRERASTEAEDREKEAEKAENLFDDLQSL